MIWSWQVVSKDKFDFVFIILCYRNTHDLQMFLQSASAISGKCRFIIVNSYFDEETKKSFEHIARLAGCDFINVPNNGYGAGNNRGIEIAKERYRFDYLIVCNPDIEFLSFSKYSILNMTDCIIAPNIKTLTGKAQNPFMSHSNPLFELIQFYALKMESKPLLYFGIAFNKILRECSNFYHKLLKAKKRRIYAAHGSCIIFGNEALQKIDIPFDENIFLFCEEFDLARIAKEKNICTYLISDLSILHKEDGSVIFLDTGISSLHKKSFIYYYEKWQARSKGDLSQ